MLVIVDNFDSFTYNLVDYFEQLNQTCVVLRNDTTIHEIERYQPKGIIISPGPGRPENAGQLLNLYHDIKGKYPILGICLGMQAIGIYENASLVKTNPVHGKQSKINHTSHPIFQGIPDFFSVVRYHSLILTALPNSLESIAFTTTGEIMAIQHKEQNIIGIQFHPESILTEYGIEILKNWLYINKLN